MRQILKAQCISSALIVMFALPCAAAYSRAIRGPSSCLKSLCVTNEILGKSVTLQKTQVLDCLYKQEIYSLNFDLPSNEKNNKDRYFMQPILDYSTNINSGNLDKPIYLRTLTFEGNGDLIKNPCVIAGSSLGVNHRHIYGKRLYLGFIANDSLICSFKYGP